MKHNFIEQMYEQFPDNFQLMLRQEILGWQHFYRTFEQLAMVDIIDHLSIMQHDQEYKERFSDIYNQYDLSLTKLSQENLEVICNRFLREIKKIGKEYGCVV